MNTQKKYQIYRSVLKIFLNNNKIRVKPLLFYKYRFMTGFREKAKLFLF